MSRLAALSPALACETGWMARTGGGVHTARYLRACDLDNADIERAQSAR